MTTDEKTLRRTPKQARSRQRFDHVLETAAQMFAQHGYEPVTTNAIAEQAGISIGSLYQFFPNKEAILEAIAARYQDEMLSTVVVPWGDDGQLPPISVVFERVIQGFMQFAATHSAFQTIFVKTSSTPPVAEITGRIHREMVTQVEALITAYFPQADPGWRRLEASIGIGIVKGLMPLADPPDAIPAPRLAQEIKAALKAHLRSALIRAGYPVPVDLDTA
jgi:AcrR family transcriptional regulator